MKRLLLSTAALAALALPASAAELTAAEQRAPPTRCYQSPDGWCYVKVLLPTGEWAGAAVRIQKGEVFGAVNPTPLNIPSLLPGGDAETGREAGKLTTR